jgi:hypothetical protein
VTTTTYRVDHLDYSDREEGDVVIALVTSDRRAALTRARLLSRSVDSGAAYVIRSDDDQDVGERAYYDGRLGNEEGTF